MYGTNGGGAGGEGQGGDMVTAGAVVSLAGNPGSGKACLAADVVSRKDVRAKFEERILWLQVMSCSTVPHSCSACFGRGGG